MKVTVISPLFPPDLAPTASYTKILLAELTSQNLNVSSIIYGQSPETVANVNFITIPKRYQVHLRLWSMARAIYKQRRTTNIFILCNGPSTEVPFWFVNLFFKQPYIFIENDQTAVARTMDSKWRSTIYRNLKNNAQANIDIKNDISSYCSPKIHPLLPYPEAAIKNFKITWDKHLIEILKQMYVRK